MESLDRLNDCVKDGNIAGLKGILMEKAVYLYGAGSYGRVLAEGLLSNGIAVEGFIDRYADRIEKIQGITIFSTDILHGLDRDQAVIIVASNIQSVADSIVDAIFQYRNDLPVLKNGFDLGRVLQESICRRMLETGAQFDLGKCVGCGSEDHDCPICIEYLKKISKPVLYEYGCRQYDRIGYILGQYCTLRCRFCFEGVPRIPKPVFTAAETVLLDVQKFARGCHFLKYVELIGGEPFMHPEFKKILRGLLELENIGYIQIFTNATVVPDEELIEILKSPRIIVQVSDYYEFVDDNRKKKIDTAKEIIVREGIQHKFIANSSWMDMNCFEKLDKSPEAVQECLRSCALANCHRLFQGILYKCPHQYAGVQQGKLKLLEGEYVEIHRFSDEQLAKELAALKKIEYLDACEHCSIIDGPVEVPPGEQMDIQEGRT